MVTAFVVIGVIGLLLAALAAFAGDLLEGVLNLDFAPEGVLSTTTLAATFAGAGFTGAFAASGFAADNPWLAAGVAVAGGAIGWLFAWGLYRLLRKQAEPEGAGNLSEVVGTTATVVTAPSEPGGFGEAMLSFRGEPLKMAIVSDEALTSGQQVTVVSLLTTTKVKVAPIEASA